MRVRYRAQVLGDIDEIGRYLEKRNPSGAFNVLRAIYAGIDLIAEQPYSSQRSNVPDVRVRVVRRYRYKIFYSIIDDNTIEIIHVRTHHGGRGKARDSFRGGFTPLFAFRLLVG